jgi:hypothetical protein
MEFPQDEYYIEDLSPTHYGCIGLRRKLFSKASQFQKLEIRATGRVVVTE